MEWEPTRGVARRDGRNGTVPCSPCSESVKRQTHTRDGVGGWHRHFAYVIIDVQAPKTPEEAKMNRRIPIGRAPPVNRRFWDTMTWERRCALLSIVTGAAVPIGTLHACNLKPVILQWSHNSINDQIRFIKLMFITFNEFISSFMNSFII